MSPACRSRSRSSARTARRSRPRSRSSRRTRWDPARSRPSRRRRRWRARPPRTAMCPAGRFGFRSSRPATQRRREARLRSPRPKASRRPRRTRRPEIRRTVPSSRRTTRRRLHRTLRAPDSPSRTLMPAEILLVEDRESLRAMLAETLTREGYSVEAVATGDEALRRLAEGRRYTLVLTDFKMPGADGLAVLRAATASDAAIPVVVLTGFGTVETAVTAMKMGAADFLSKPVDPDLLLLLV